MGNKAAKEKAAADGVDVHAHDDSSFTDALRVHLQRLIVYAEGSDPALQREVCYSAMMVTRSSFVVSMFRGARECAH